MSRRARATAWIFLGFGVLVLVAGVAQFVLVKTGPQPPGCGGHVATGLAFLALLAASVVGVPHVVAPLWFLKRPRSGRVVFLALLAVNAAVDVAMIALHLANPAPPVAFGFVRAPVVWLALLAANTAALWILLRRPRAKA